MTDHAQSPEDPHHEADDDVGSDPKHPHPQDRPVDPEPDEPE